MFDLSRLITTVAVRGCTYPERPPLDGHWYGSENALYHIKSLLHFPSVAKVSCTEKKNKHAKKLNENTMAANNTQKISQERVCFRYTATNHGINTTQLSQGIVPVYNMYIVRTTYLPTSKFYNINFMYNIPCRHVIIAEVL